MDPLDRALNEGPPPVPSPEFAARVMASVHRTAVDPPPLRFPWGRYVAGVAACGGSAAGVAGLLVRVADSPLGGALAPAGPALSYAAAAVLVTLAAWYLREPLEDRE